MASGDSLFVARSTDFAPTGANPASRDIRAGGSTPTEAVAVLDFDASTQEYADFHGTMPEHYGGGGLTCSIRWAASSATSGVTRWGIAFRRIADDAEDVDASHTYVYNDGNATAASASGEYDYFDITFTDGADMDSVAAGDEFVLRLTRDAADGGDTMTGDAELVSVHVTET
jgi:hypothetical protein